MRSMRGLIPLLIVAAVAVAWFFFSEFASKSIGGFFDRSSYNGAVVGRIVRAEGSTRLVHGTDVTLIPSPTPKPIEFRDGDRLQTSIEAKVIFILNSGDEFELGAGGVALFQLWNSKDAGSPIYVQNQLGNLQLIRPGVKGKAYIVKNGRLYLPGQKPLEKAMALTVLKSAPLDLTLAENAGDTPEFQPGDKADGVEPAVSPNASDPETLSNEYIDEMILSRQALLQKCWLSRLKDAPKLKGQIVLQFEITKRGRVREIRVAEQTVNDEPLQKCVMSVVERITFRQFKGSEISLSYPINFE